MPPQGTGEPTRADNVKRKAAALLAVQKVQVLQQQLQALHGVLAAAGDWCGNDTDAPQVRGTTQQALPWHRYRAAGDIHAAWLG